VRGELVALGLAAAAFGALVGAGELAGRYRDRPWEVIRGPGVLYVALNAAMALGALALIRSFGWRFGVDPSDGDSGALLATQLLVAGFGSAALFRTSLFTVRVGDEDIGVGPSAFLTVVLHAADRAVDRRRGRARALEVEEIMRNVSFAKAAEALPMYCFQIGMQNVSDEEQREIGNVVNTLKASTTVDDGMKALVLGAALLSVVGPVMLRQAVEGLGDRIRRDPPRP
jgi:hypothetical protein